MNKKNFSIKLGITICIFCLIVNSLSLMVFAEEESLKIAIFTASETDITRGDSSVLKWEVSGADRIDLEGPDKMPESQLPLIGSFEVFPIETTTYTLIAISKDGKSISKSITVTVNDNLDTVVIDDFSASEYTISPDTNVELSWIVRNEEKIELIDSNENTIGLEKDSTTITVKPIETTTYTLIAKSAEQSEEVSITINVEKSEDISNMKINKFFADRTSVPKGGTVFLNWSVENAKEVTLDYLSDNWYSIVENSGTAYTTIYETRTFELNVTDNEGNTIIKKVTVEVIEEEENSQASITEFKSSSYLVKPGENFSIIWNTDYAKEVKLTESFNNTTETLDSKSGKIDLSIENTTIYTLTAIGENNLKSTAIITIEVENSELVNIKEFSASSYTIDKGELVKLTWDVKNASTCFISTTDSNVLDNIPLSGSVYVTPNKTETFKLIAYAVNQEVKISEITITVNN